MQGQNPGWTQEELIGHISVLNGEIIALRQRLDESEWVEESLRKRTRALNERMKELECIYGILNMVRRPGFTEAQRLQGIADRLPSALLNTKSACARIIVGGARYDSAGFEETPWVLATTVTSRGKPAGMVEVRYRDKQPQQDDGPFLKEERQLLRVVAEAVGLLLDRR